MSSPGPQENFNWDQIAPDALTPEQQAQAVRQVRIMLASGKSRADVQVWLEEFGLTPEQGEAFLETSAPFSHQGSTSAHIGGLLGASMGVFVSIVVTLVFRPWSVEWSVRGDGGTPVHPLVALLFWFLSLAPLTIMLWFVGVLLGQILHRLTRGGNK